MIELLCMAKAALSSANVAVIVNRIRETNIKLVAIVGEGRRKGIRRKNRGRRNLSRVRSEESGG